MLNDKDMVELRAFFAQSSAEELELFGKLLANTIPNLAGDQSENAVKALEMILEELGNRVWLLGVVHNENKPEILN